MSFELTAFYSIVFLLCHFIGDYYIQTTEMAHLKEKSFKKTIRHCFLYGIPFLALILVFAATGSLTILIFGITAGIGILHAVIDIGKFIAENNLLNSKENDADKVKRNENAKRNIYIADQLLHIGVILGAAFILKNETALPTIVFETEYAYSFLKIALFAVIIAKPVNVSFKKIFTKYQPKPKFSEEAEEKTFVSGAGATIGTMERLLIGIFIGLNQFAAIGLVITAKSIARYDKISKEQSFAEYFLIGTLYSALATIIIFYLIFRI